MHEVKIDNTINKRTLTGSNTDDTCCGGVSLRCCLYGCALNYLADLIQPRDWNATTQHQLCSWPYSPCDDSRLATVLSLLQHRALGTNYPRHFRDFRHFLVSNNF